MPAHTQKRDDTLKNHMTIAIVGIGALFPGAENLGDFWRNIISGRDLVTEVPPTHWIIEDHYHPDPTAADKTYCKRGAFLPPTNFDPLAFKIPPANLSSTDTSQLLGLKVAQQVLDDVAQRALGRVKRDRISVILGVASGLELLGEMNSRLQRPAWFNALRESGIPDGQAADICDRIASQYAPWTESTFPGLLGNVVAGRIASHFDLGGTNCTVDAACASSFSAMSMAVNELCLGLADLVITGGVDTTNGPFLHTCFSKTPAMSPTGDCRPFSDKADGVVIGEGIGMVALKRLGDAELDGDRIYAVIRGIGTSSDGSGKSVFTPLRQGQEKALRRCYDMAGYPPETVALLEAHGTGTATGDRVEFEALRRVFHTKDSKRRQWCALGSIKSQIGHTKSAAGVAGLIKAVMALHNSTLPPTIKVDQPDACLDLPNSPFYLNTKTRPWFTQDAHPPRASVSAFGFGGTNFHVAVEAYQGSGKQALKQRAFPSELILLDSDAPSALLARCREVAAQAQTPGMLAAIAKSSQKSFNPKAPVRLAIVAGDEKDLEQKINHAVAAIPHTSGRPHAFPPDIYYGLSLAQPGALAFLFPGQGGQYPEMGADPAMHLDTARKIWEIAAGISMADGLGLHDIVFPRPAFSEEEIAAQHRKLNLAQWAIPAISTMSLSIAAVLERFGIHPDCVCGHSAGVITALRAAGMLDTDDSIKLAHEHGKYMAGNADHRFLAHLGTLPLNPPDRPIYANTEAAPYPNDVDMIRQRLVKQMDQPDRFEQVIEAMYADGVRIFVEVGPGLTLTERVDRCLFHRPHMTTHTDRKGDSGITQLWNVLGKLAIHGMAVDFSAMWDGYAPVIDPRLKQVSDFSVHLLGCNYDRPYPPHAQATGEITRQPSSTSTENSATAPSKPSSEQLKMEKTAMTLKKNSEADHAPGPPTDATPQRAQAHNAPISSQTTPPGLDGNERMTPWIDAIVEIQRQTAKTHTTFQKNMTESHVTFLKTAEASTRALGGMVTGEPARQPQIGWRQTATEPSLRAQPIPTPMSDPPVVSSPQKPISTESVEREKTFSESPPQTQTVEYPAAQRFAVDPPGKPDDATRPESATINLSALLFEVVAQKTGYPQEVLNVEMNLESDLGIDSIKRVEILSAVSDRVPKLPELDTARLAELQTLEDVLEYMRHVSDAPAHVSPSEGSSRSQELVDSQEHIHEKEPGRYGLREMPAPHRGNSIAEHFHTGFCAVTDDGTGIAHALTRRLTESGVDARVVEDVPEYADAVIFLGGLRDSLDPVSAIEVNRKAFSAARKVAKRFSTTGGFFATIQDTGGNFGLSGREETRAWLAGLPGLIKTAAIEWPYATVKALDLERSDRSPDALARVILRELLDGGPEIEVGLRADGQRIRLESYPMALEHRYPMMDENSVIVASGGARGVTAAALVQLAHRFHPKIALLGRTVLDDEPACCQGAVTDSELKRALLQAAQAEGQAGTPVQIEQSTRHVLALREIRSTVQALEAAGAETLYLNVDIRDASAVTSGLDLVRQKWGPITGIVHGAGVIKDKTIKDKTMAMFDTVFNTKVLGLRSLLTATAADPLALICLFSSVAARRGNPGQCDYAMANEVLNKVAHAQARQRNHTCVVKSINWGPWDGGMVSDALKAHFEQAGIPLIPLDVGARMFVDEIQAAPSDAVEVAIARELDKLGLGQHRFVDYGLGQ